MLKLSSSLFSSWSSRFLCPFRCRIPRTSFFSTEDLIFQPFRFYTRASYFSFESFKLSKSSFQELASESEPPNSSRLFLWSLRSYLACFLKNRCLIKPSSCVVFTILQTSRFLFILSSFERCTHHHSHHCQLFQTSILLLSLFIGSYFLISAVNVFLSLIIWKPLHTVMFY